MKFSREIINRLLPSKSIIIIVIVLYYCSTTAESVSSACKPESAVKCWTCGSAKSISSCALDGEWKDCVTNEICSFTLKRNNATLAEDEIHMGCLDGTMNGEIIERQEQIQLINDTNTLECSSHHVGSICYDSSAGVGKFEMAYHKMRVLFDAFNSQRNCTQLMDKFLINDGNDNSRNFNNSNPIDNSAAIDNSTGSVEKALFFEFLKPFNPWPAIRSKRNSDPNMETKTYSELYNLIYLKPLPEDDSNNNNYADEPGSAVAVGKQEHHVCGKIMCTMFCEFGFENDKYGCPICKCVLPCERVSCKANEHCEVRTLQVPAINTVAPQGVCVPNACSPVLCRMACQYGFMKDKMGCEFCQCFEPCERANCSKKQFCEVKSSVPCDSHPYTTKGVCVPKEACSPVRCRMHCEYGFRKNELGCEICKCHQPCETVKCTKDTRCAAVEVSSSEYDVSLYKYRGACVPNDQCPPMKCSLFCNYGYLTDEYGCFYCKCYEPCSTIECARGLRCAVKECKSTEDHPHRYKGVCVPDVKCSPVACYMACQYGYIRDENGCELCQCFEPCAKVKCDKGRHCVAEEVVFTEAYPYYFMGICNPDHECSPVMCRMFCQYGFVVDEFGCEVCNCYEPCQTVSCEANRHCEVQSVNKTAAHPYTGIGVCVPDIACLPVLCEMFCRYGFQKDEMGCEQCLCYEPCLVTLCAVGHKCEVQPTIVTKEHPYPFQAVCIPNKECLPVLCKMLCRYGFEKDEYGCEQCSCYEPCQLVDCIDGRSCEVEPFTPTPEHPYKYRPVCVPIVSDHCTCTIYGDPMMIMFNGSRIALLEPKQYTLTSYQDSVHGDKIAIYVIIEQTGDIRFPGNLDVQKLTITYGNEFIVMDAEKVTVNSRFATPLPYTDPAHRFNITSEQEPPAPSYRGLNPKTVDQKLNTFRLQTASGISLVVSPKRQEDKVTLSAFRGAQTTVSAEGLCGSCS